MMATRKVLALAVALLVATAIATPAFGLSEFLFYGYSKYWDGDPPDEVGSLMEVYGILEEVEDIPCPIDLDFDNYQYTVYISTMMVVYYNGNVPAYLKSMIYDNGEIHIFADPIVGGTAADYGDLPTFMDGEMILHATVDDGWAANLYDLDMDGDFTMGDNAGTCDFDGGTQLDALIAAEYYLDDWGFFGSPYVDPEPPFTTVPPGFHRIFNTKLTPPNDPSPAEPSTWGRVKDLYR